MLDDPESFKIREGSKLSVPDFILQPGVYPDPQIFTASVGSIIIRYTLITNRIVGEKHECRGQADYALAVSQLV